MALRIKTNTDGAKAINTLVDIALKSGGLQNLPAALEIMNSVDVDQEYFDKQDKEAKEREEKAKKPTPKK